MTINNFDKAFSAVLITEGGFINHPKDPGGATNFGITQKVYDGWRKKNHQTTQDVKFITNGVVKEIYFTQYWQPAGCDKMPTGIDYVVFDGAVNSGVTQSIKWLQRALNVNADGHFGYITLQALNECQDHDQLIATILDLRIKFLGNLVTWGYFGKGWIKRVNSVEKRAQAWASGSVGPEPEYIEGAQAKALIKDAKRPSSAPADNTVLVGAAGILLSLEQAKRTLEPVASISSIASNGVAAIAIVSAFIIIGGIIWKLWVSYKQNKHEEAIS